MVLKRVFPALLGAILLSAALPMAGGAMAADYRPDQFLSLDLSRAVLSPTPIGPPTQFAPVPLLDSSSDRFDRSADAASERSALSAPAKQVAVERINVPPRHALAQAEKPRGAARTGLARRHSNPLDAEARDMRIQKWPCNRDSGGICNWKR
jgi:hypothetical protein